MFDATRAVGYGCKVVDSYALAAVVAKLATYTSALDSPEPGARAAVAAILRDGTDGEAEVLLVRRAEHPSDPWSGHMALPGGRKDATDASLLETALRETREEVGIDLKTHGRLLARLPDHPAIARGRRVGLVIAPFVFALDHEQPIALSDEIAEALWTPLGPLARGEGRGTFPYTIDDTIIELPFLDVQGRRVWGLTYQMLQVFFCVLHG
jgi:8-oxo-dGTP pyrophosphatase MutT (NUDIX family)